VGCRNSSLRPTTSLAESSPPYSSVPVPRTTPTPGLRHRTQAEPLARYDVAWRPAAALPDRSLPPARLATLEYEVARWVADERQLLHPPATTRRWQYIVLHHSASENDSLETIDRFHREVRGWDGCGYHFIIGNGSYSGDGQIEVSRRWLEQKHGAHTKVPGHPEYNQFGIGICLVGNFEQHPPSARQVQAAQALIAYLMARYAIPPSNVSLHRVLARGRTACPGRYFPEELLLPRNR